MKHLAFLFLLAIAVGCTGNKGVNTTPAAADDSVVSAVAVVDSTSMPEREITEDLAYQGVNNYCHRTYDWSVAADNPSIMYVQKGEESDSTFQVIFRSYTGAFVYFYVDKLSGSTRMVEYVPSMDITSEAGTINLFDYLDNEK